ncbi:DUF3500 domain-containing protein [Aestuariibaculum lutulentum]|uniref:DUF3500 domain-containing protein n=1 Tax=Aestuariibaculum lutulentum TaxID=2920935 RepID=A0ABS9REH8_9FLAO|nr:DUF3500 domain-containing protein [Aestuariibaculum lutulentum]MCH4551317.1 DUF3500 domain-containing protein [Aestuariibaculum lutulentum]
MKRFFNYVVIMLMCPMLVLSCSSDNGSSSSETEEETGSTTADPIDITTCDSETGINQLVCIAEAFLSQLSSSEQTTVQLSYSTTTAKKWSNFPESIYRNRPGLSFGEMTDTQVSYAKALIKAAAGTTSNEGWEEIEQTLNADDYLNAAGGGSGYGAGNYYIAILGTPSATGLWEIMFGGHHFAFANTYEGGVLVGATPSFRGIEPYGTFTYNSESNQPLNQERDAFSEMLEGLSSSELATAKLSGTWNDLLCGPQSDDNFPSTASGVQVGTLTSAQQELVMAAIKTYVLDIADDDAADILTTYENELSNTYVSYSGTTTMTTKGDYVRIDGPSVWIEFSVQNGVILSDPHPHSVWRDKNGDYGGN